MASSAENVSIWWRHQVNADICLALFCTCSAHSSISVQRVPEPVNKYGFLFHLSSLSVNTIFAFSRNMLYLSRNVRSVCDIALLHQLMAMNLIEMIMRCIYRSFIDVFIYMYICYVAGYFTYFLCFVYLQCTCIWLVMKLILLDLTTGVLSGVPHNLINYQAIL